MLKCGLCQDVTGMLHQCGEHAEGTPLSACLLALAPLGDAICLSLGEAMTHSYPAECAVVTDAASVTPLASTQKTKQLTLLLAPE